MIVAGAWYNDFVMSRTRKQAVRVKRIYDAPSKDDGVRILVDRIWPRGIKKTDAALDEWLKDVAPTSDLRQWFGHDPEKWPEFRKRYGEYLAENESARAAVDTIREHLKEKPVTLLFAAKDAEHNNAVVLAEFVEGSC